MIEFAKFTGELRENRYQVQLRTGEHLLVPMMVFGTSVTLPTQKWIDENKDSFMAVLSYEKDLYISPLIIGLYPVKGASSASYNSIEKLLVELKKLLDQLQIAKVNTQIGPQPFLPDTLEVFKDVRENLDDISSYIEDINL